MKRTYRIPAGMHQESEIIKKSRFLASAAHAPTIAEAKAFIERIRSRYPDATHNCWAYTAAPPGDSSRCGMSDDGEPHGTAGQPMLNVLLHADVGEIAVVVTRYFGGVKLGKGGLVRAYAGAVKNLLEKMETEEKRAWARYRITLSYADHPSFAYRLQQLEGRIIENRYDASVHLVVELPEENKASLENALAAASVEFTAEPTSS